MYVIYIRYEDMFLQLIYHCSSDCFCFFIDVMSCATLESDSLSDDAEDTEDTEESGETLDANCLFPNTGREVPARLAKVSRAEVYTSSAPSLTLTCLCSCTRRGGECEGETTLEGIDGTCRENDIKAWSAVDKVRRWCRASTKESFNS